METRLAERRVILGERVEHGLVAGPHLSKEQRVHHLRGALRVANKAQAELYAAIKRDGGTQNMVERMQTRAELYATIGYHDYEALDASIVTTIIPQAMPQP